MPVIDAARVCMYSREGICEEGIIGTLKVNYRGTEGKHWPDHVILVMFRMEGAHSDFAG